MCYFKYMNKKNTHNLLKPQIFLFFSEALSMCNQIWKYPPVWGWGSLNIAFLGVFENNRMKIKDRVLRFTHNRFCWCWKCYVAVADVVSLEKQHQRNRLCVHLSTLSLSLSVIQLFSFTNYSVYKTITYYSYIYHTNYHDLPLPPIKCKNNQCSLTRFRPKFPFCTPEKSLQRV